MASVSKGVVERFCFGCWSKKNIGDLPLIVAKAPHQCLDCSCKIERGKRYVRILNMDLLEEFLLERQDISVHRRHNYRQAFMALSEYTDKPFSLKRNEMNLCLERLS